MAETIIYLVISFLVSLIFVEITWLEIQHNILKNKLIKKSDDKN